MNQIISNAQVQLFTHTKLTFSPAARTNLTISFLNRTRIMCHSLQLWLITRKAVEERVEEQVVPQEMG